MTSDAVYCFLPCRKGSERVPHKNTKPFAHLRNGLIEIKLGQLLRTERITQIVLSSNDEDVLSFAGGLDTGKILIHRRSDQLSSSATSTDELVSHARELVAGDGHILWTHVTSPFVTASSYDDMLERYFLALSEGYDSLMTTTLLHGFLWNESGPLNYDRAAEKWPRTQTLPPIHEINSAAFIAHTSIYESENDRIGKNPFKYGMNKIVGLDIDWPQDFVVAESLVSNGLAEI